MGNYLTLLHHHHLCLTAVCCALAAIADLPSNKVPGTCNIAEEEVLQYGGKLP